MRAYQSILLVSVLSFAVPVCALADDLTDPTGDALQLIMPTPEAAPVVVPEPEPAPPPAPPTPTWIDMAKVIDQYRIPEKVANLRAVAVDPSGKNYGFYFASDTRKTFSVYRNGRRMLTGATEILADKQKPVLFRMTASGDLLYAVHNTDLYVNNVAVSLDRYSFSVGTTSVHEEGGMLTYPDGGNVMVYDIKANAKRTLYSHGGTIIYMRRVGKTVAYALRERTTTRMYSNGRLVSQRAVDNPANFAISKEGNVFYFTKAARGYALFRDTRSYVTGVGAGAFVDVDAKGVPWFLSYSLENYVTVVRLQKGRSPQNLLPSGVTNVELSLTFPGHGYALRGSFENDPTAFQLIRDGNPQGDTFPFEFPYNDTNGLSVWGDSVVLRAFDGTSWSMYVDGVPTGKTPFRTVWFARVQDGQLTVYATK